jgi:hypothetical protein
MAIEVLVVPKSMPKNREARMVLSSYPIVPLERTRDGTEVALSSITVLDLPFGALLRQDLE